MQKKSSSIEEPFLYGRGKRINTRSKSSRFCPCFLFRPLNLKLLAIASTWRNIVFVSLFCSQNTNKALPIYRGRIRLAKSIMAIKQTFCCNNNSRLRKVYQELCINPFRVDAAAWGSFYFRCELFRATFRII